MIGESNTLGELQAERLAAEATCIAGEWVRVIFELMEYDSDEVRP